MKNSDLQGAEYDAHLCGILVLANHIPREEIAAQLPWHTAGLAGETRSTKLFHHVIHKHLSGREEALSRMGLAHFN